MTPGLYPPDSLSKDDIQKLSNVRRDIWMNGLQGGGFGVCSGLVLHTGAQYAKKFGWIRPSTKFNRNTVMLSVLGGGALGMFLFAASTGKQQVHNLHPIFQIGANPRGPSNDYRSKQRMSSQDAGDDGMSSTTTTTTEQQQQMQQQQQQQHSNDIDMQKLERIRLLRRRSLMNQINNGHGLSDSHGGHWYSKQGQEQQQNDK